jgi:hypothetical protein
MKINYEKIWLDITGVKVNNVKTVKKCTIRYRKDCGICYFIGEFEFVTSDQPVNVITIEIPQISDPFIPCENTILVTKTQDGDEIDTHVRVRLVPGCLSLISYPFSANTDYSVNVQLFMCLTHEKFMEPKS